MPEINPKLSNEQMKELEDEALRNATVGTQTGIQDTFEKTTSKAEELFSEASKALKEVEEKEKEVLLLFIIKMYLFIYLMIFLSAYDRI